VEISQHIKFVLFNRTDCRSTRNFGWKLSSAQFEGDGTILPFLIYIPIYDENQKIRSKVSIRENSFLPLLHQATIQAMYYNATLRLLV
jgi:hypothetical protein